MLADSHVVAFIPTVKPEQARTFYEQQLGLELVAEDSFALVFRGHGTTIRVVRLQQFQPAPFTVLGWEVSDIHEAVRDLHGKGIEFQRYPGMEQDQLGIWKSPGGARVAWFTDPDGNVLSLSQH